MENIKLAIEELGARTGLEMSLDENGSCTLELADGRVVVLQLRENLDELDLVALLGEVPDDLRADVFTRLLAANYYWRETLGATLSWNPEMEQVVLAYPFPLANATIDTLDSIFKRFLELQAAWKDRLAEFLSEGDDDAEEASMEDFEGEDAADDAEDRSDVIINP